MKRFITILAIILFIQGSSVFAKMTNEAHNLYQKACQLEYQHKYSEAIQLIYEAINVNGDDAILYTKLAGLYTDLGDNQNALAAYKRAIKMRPNDAFIYISIGNILQNMNDYDNAYKAYMQAMDLFPAYKYNYSNIANILYLQGNYAQAIEYYNLFLGSYPDHFDARENLANSYLRNNDYLKAIDEFGTLYSKNPTLFKDYGAYGYALFKEKQYSTAIDMFKQALRQNPENISTIGYLAVSYQETKKYNESKAAYEKVFVLKPDAHFLRLGYADLLRDMNDNDNAITQYNTYIKTYPQDISAYTKLGMVYKNSAKYDDAITTFKKVLELDPTDTSAERAIGEVYHAKGDYINALKYYDNVLEVEDNREVLANKALVLHALKKYDEAISLYYDLLAEQSNERLRHNLIEALCYKGDKMLSKAEFKDALTFYDKVLEIDSDNAKAYFGLAKSYENLNLIDKAKEYYKKAMDVDSANQEYKNAYEQFSKTFLSDVKTADKDVLQESTPQKIDSKINSLLIENNPDQTADKAKALIAEGDSLYKQTRFDEALNKYLEAIKINPNDATTLFKIGNLYKMTNDTNKAVEFYKKATTLNKNYTDAYFNLGLSYATLNNYKLCRECFNKVISLNPNYAYAYYAMAMSYEKDEDYANAVKYYKSYYNLEKNEETKRTISGKINSLEAKLP